MQKKLENHFAIIEVDAATLPKFMELESIFVKWGECRVNERGNVVRCYKCRGFSHHSNE
jgi:hypothetical protein